MKKYLQIYRALTTNLFDIKIPKNIQDVLETPEWRASIGDEICALKKNETWELPKLPKGIQHVGCKWILNVKYKVDRSVDHYKVRIVAKGFTHAYEINYRETFASRAKLNTILALLSLATNLDCFLHQLDVKNVFLNDEDLKDEVYMEILLGFETRSNANKVYGLQKSLYDLK